MIGPLIARKAYAEIGAQVRTTAETLQIEALLSRKPGQLSGDSASAPRWAARWCASRWRF